MKEAQTLVRDDMQVEVTYPDERKVVYDIAPIDIWRTEQFLGKPLVVMAMEFGAISHLAYCAAQRAGDTYRPRKATTDKRELFEGWLESIVNVKPMAETELAEAEDDAAPLVEEAASSAA